MRRVPMPSSRDTVLAVVLAAGTQAELWLTGAVPGGVSGWNVLLGLAITLPLAWRASHPVPVGLGVQALYAAATPVVAIGDLFSDAIVVFVVATYTVAVGARTLRTSVLGGLACAGLVGVQGLFDPMYGDSAAAANVVVVALVWSVAAAVRANAARAVRYRQEAEDARGHTEQAAAEAVHRERARLARELHDVVAHGLSIVVLQARGARHAVTADPDQAARAMVDVEHVARRALADMRHLLNLLHDEPAAADALQPQPSLRHLDELIEPVRSTGVQVDVCHEGDVRPLTRGTDVSAYRIVQEALTNVIRHARAHRAQVTVRWSDTQVELEICDDGTAVPSPTPGRGLLGMRERVEVLGGSLSAGAEPGGGYAVRARLPVADG